MYLRPRSLNNRGKEPNLRPTRSERTNVFNYTGGLALRANDFVAASNRFAGPEPLEASGGDGERHRGNLPAGEDVFAV